MLHADILGERARITPGSSPSSIGRRAPPHLRTDGRARSAVRPRVARVAGPRAGRPGRPAVGQPGRVPRRILRGHQVGRRLRPARRQADGPPNCTRSSPTARPAHCSTTRRTRESCANWRARSGSTIGLPWTGRRQAVTRATRTCWPACPTGGSRGRGSIPRPRAACSTRVARRDGRRASCSRTGWWRGTATNTAISWQLRDDDVTPVFTPLYHAGGLGAFLVPILTIGGTVVLHREFDAEEAWDTIETRAVHGRARRADDLQAVGRVAQVRHRGSQPRPVAHQRRRAPPPSTSSRPTRRGEWSSGRGTG